MQFAIAGGGAAGLSAGLLLAGDGHHVFVLDRDRLAAPDKQGLGVRPVGLKLQRSQESLHGRAHVVEALLGEDALQCCSISATRLPVSSTGCRPVGGGEDQLGAPIGRIGASLEVTQPFQLTDELRGGSRAQLRPVRHVRQPDAVDAHVAEDVQMGFAQVGVTVLARW